MLRSRAFATVFLIAVTATFSYSMAFPFQSIFLVSLGAPVATVGLVFVLRDMVQIVLRIPLGSLSDRIGRRPFILLGALCLASVQLVWFFAWSLEPIFLAALINGFGLAMFYPAIEASASDLAPPGRVGETVGLFSAYWPLSSIIGPLIGGFLAETFLSYRLVFLMTFCLISASLAVFAMLSKETLYNPSKMRRTDELKGFVRQIIEFPQTLRSLFVRRGTLSSSLSIFALSFSTWACFIYYPIYSTHLGLSDLMIALSLSVYSLISFISMPYSGKLSDRVGRAKPMIMGFAVSAVAFATLPFLNEYSVLLILLSVLGFGSALVQPSTMAGTVEDLNSRERGAGIGVWGTMMTLGGVAGSSVMSTLVSFLDIVWIFYFSALASLASAITIFFARSKFR